MPPGPPPLVHPVFPDFHVCDELYGTGLLIGDCMQMLQLPYLVHPELITFSTSEHGPNVLFDTTIGSRGLAEELMSISTNSCP